MNIEISQLVKDYGKFRALDEGDLHIIWRNFDVSPILGGRILCCLP
jgi:hypothetical protein